MSEQTVSQRIQGKHIVLCVSGSIAAFKATSLASLLVKQGAAVRVVLTQAAENFVGKATFAGLTGYPVACDMFDPSRGGELHVELSAWADLIVIAPATADVLARLAQGRASDPLSALALCARSPMLLAPAMHPAMWAHPATRRNVATVGADGLATFVGPVEGMVASGEVGVGRMAEPEAILEAIASKLNPTDLAGRHIVVSAGPTVEDLDPVRFIGNRSSGKMGFALAARAAARGARVTLVTGPVLLPTPPGVDRVDVRAALQMQGELEHALGSDLSAADALIMSAAVADFRPAERAEHKLKRDPRAASAQLALVQNPDLLAAIGSRRASSGPFLVGFAVETGDDASIVAHALRKLEAKRVDLIVANRADEAFGGDGNRACFVSRDQIDWLNPMSKTELADRILDRIAAELGSGAQ
jgi:phosphopantothenoylcysteine decarboxylase/phosphopantothenate--cysteine ligase